MTPDVLIPFPGGWIGALLLVVCGLVMCGSGSRIVRLALGLSGFVLAGAAAASVTALFTHSGLWTGIAFVVLGILGAGIAGLLLPVGMFVLGGAFGYAMCSLFIPSVLVAWVAALVWALVFAILQKRVLALGTAALGSLFALEGVMLLLFAFETVREFLEAHADGIVAPALFIVAWLLLAVSGYRKQVHGRPGSKKKERGEDD
jgi:hypothetical protein